MGDKKPLSEIISERVGDHFEIPPRDRLIQGLIRFAVGLVVLAVALVEVLLRLAIRVLESALRGLVSVSMVVIDVGTSWISELFGGNR